MEGVSKMRVTGKPELKRQLGEISCAIGNLVERGAQSKAILVGMQTRPGFAPENAGQMEWRTEDNTGDVAQTQFLTKPF